MCLGNQNKFRPGTYNDKSQLSDIKYSMRPRTLNPCIYIYLRGANDDRN